jgi:hypothetical protein
MYVAHFDAFAVRNQKLQCSKFREPNAGSTRFSPRLSLE